MSIHICYSRFRSLRALASSCMNFLTIGRDALSDWDGYNELPYNIDNDDSGIEMLQDVLNKTKCI